MNKNAETESRGNEIHRGPPLEETPAPEQTREKEPDCQADPNPEKEPEGGIEPESGQGQEEDLNAKYLRLMADFQNYKRRVEKEKADVYAYANEKLVGELLDVIDDFERALAHEGDAAEGFAEGMRMIFKNFKGVLEKSGMEEIEALGVRFDPNVHNAVMTGKSGKFASGFVCEVLQKGYKLNKRVIRPSMVKVAE